MSTPLSVRIRLHLYRGKKSTPCAVADAIPELAECGGEQRALLLMRLDPQLEPVGDDHWTVRGRSLTEEQTVRQAAESYFKSINRPGIPLNSMVTEISRTTKMAELKVLTILVETYAVYGSNIFNRPKHQEDK